MSIDRRKAALYGSAIAIRLLLCTAFPSLPDLLTGRVEISTPVTSFKRRTYKAAVSHLNASFETDIGLCVVVQEGVFLYTHNVSPYDGGVFHQVRPKESLYSDWLFADTVRRHCCYRCSHCSRSRPRVR